MPFGRRRGHFGIRCSLRTTHGWLVRMQHWQRIGLRAFGESEPKFELRAKTGLQRVARSDRKKVHFPDIRRAQTNQPEIHESHPARTWAFCRRHCQRNAVLTLTNVPADPTGLSASGTTRTLPMEWRRSNPTSEAFRRTARSSSLYIYI